MPIFLDQTSLQFPGYDEADEHGIIALGGDLRPERLLLAYESGIFPWPHDNLPLLWFFPNPRYILKPGEILVNKSLKKAIKNSNLEIVADRDFKRVIQCCQKSTRPEQNSTWITDELIEGYCTLHRQGYAHSIEAYRSGKLVGGLYGVSLGSMFFGESMFYHENNASKICLVTLAANLKLWQFNLIDCQMNTQTLEKFGAQAMSKERFIAQLKESQKRPSKIGPWQLELSKEQALDLLR